MLPITQMLITNRKTRPALRNREFYTIRKLKGLVIHWTANTDRGANAVRNRNYFNTTTVYASAHYIVDDHTIVQCLPDHEVGYHVGGSSYRPIGERIRENDLTPNYFLIGLEMCVNSDGDWNKTYQHSVDLAAHILNKYNFTVNDMYRHYDITGKLCPAMMIEEKDWQAFRNAVNKKLDFKLENPLKKGYINTADLNVREGNGVQYKVVDNLKLNHKVQIYEELDNWYRIGDNRWVHKHYVAVTFEKKDGIVEDPTGLNVRSGPGTSNPVVEVLPNGKKVEVIDQEGDWYQLGPDRWAYYKLVKIVEARMGRVQFANFLNVRSGAGTNFPRVKQIQMDSLVNILQEEGSWYNIGQDEWVYNAFIKVIE